MRNQVTMESITRVPGFGSSVVSLDIYPSGTEESWLEDGPPDMYNPGGTPFSTFPTFASGMNSGQNVGMQGHVLVPPATNTEALTLKGAAGDTGIPLDPIGLQVLTFADAAQKWSYSAAGAVTGNEIRFF